MTRALVTGASHRLGRAIALFLADRGFDVAVHYGTSQDAARDVVDLIKGKGCHAVALQADLMHDRQTEGLLPAAADALGGPITCLINNASIFEHDSVGNATRESWDRHMQTNLRGPFILTQAMANQGLEPAVDGNGEPVAQGLIVNMVDQRVRKLTPGFATYTLAKMALWALTQTSARALAPAIRVNAIGPGPTLQDTHQTDDHYRNQRSRTVLKRGSNLSDITGAVGYFLDAPGVTGQLLCTDGGQHLNWKTPDVMTAD